MKKMAKDILAALLVASFAIAPTANAQQAPDASTPADTSAVPADTTSATTPTDASSTPPVADTTQTTGSVNPQDTNTPLQDTVNTQPAVTGDMLLNTADPAAASTTDQGALIPLYIVEAQSTSTDPAATPVVEAPAPDNATPVEATPDVTPPVADTPLVDTPPDATVPDAVQIAAPDKAPDPIALVAAPEDPKYDFGVTGKTTASKRKIKNAAGDVIGEANVTAPFTASADAANNTLTVSGQCSDKYFVVLLYKNPNDYDTDPSSFILNTAHPCVNGTYTYAIADLPLNVANGTYYLLIGQEGDRTAWVPITGVTEININRAQ